MLRRSLRRGPQRWTTIAAGIKGVTEETTTGVHRLYEMAEAGTLLFPAINVNDSVTKSQVRQQVRLPALADRRHQPRHRRADRRQGRGRVSATATSARAARSRCAARAPAVIVTEIDPICALQAAMDGYQVATLDDVVETADIFITATGCYRRDHRRAHGADEAPGDRRQHRPLRQRDRHGRPGPGARTSQRVNIKPQVDEWVFADGHSIIVLSEGRLLNLGNATGHPSFVMSNSFSNQTIAQIELFTKTDEYPMRRLHAAQAPRREGRPAAPGRPRRASSPTLTKEQAEYLGVPVEGPFKPDHYRY